MGQDRDEAGVETRVAVNAGRATHRTDQSRGQTTLDFAVGVVIFIGIVGFTFFFVSGAVSPFTGSPQDDTVTANRVADRLAADRLGSPARPYVLNASQTVEFFTTGAPADQLNLGDSQRVNVTVVGNVTGPSTADDEAVPLCWDDDDRRVVARTAGTCDDPLTAGDDLTGEDSVITARRSVLLANRDVVLLVEVW